MRYAYIKALPIYLSIASFSGFGCNSSTEPGTGLGDDGQNGQGGSSNVPNANGGSPTGPSEPGIDFGDGLVTSGGSSGMTPLTPDQACVADSRQGSQAVVALYFMVDISGSMQCPVPDSDPPCEVDPGAPYSNVTRWTETSTALKDFFSSSESNGMWAGAGFFPRGGGCNASDYSSPAAEIALLPSAVSQMNLTIDAQTPGGQTPTLPSLQGAIDHAKSWSTANPNQQVVLVYATDGYPRGCGDDNTIANAAQAVDQAFTGTPSIRTYVLGVGPNLTDLNQIAVAGGTGQAFFVDVGQDVTAQLTAALGTIRSDVTLDCTYTIPEPPVGQQLNYGLVNVRYTNGGGTTLDVARDPSEAACTVGWQYSADRTQIQLCGDTCNAVKADPGARIDVLFGCATRVDVIR